VDAIIGDAPLRLSLFLLVLGATALGEVVAPRRALTHSRWRRWPANLAIVAIGAALVRLALPVTAVSTAALAARHGWGLLNGGVTLPTWAAVAVSVIVLDLAIYLQHVVFHAVPVLWRLHRMHHADLDVDATTGARFHPLELLLSVVVKVTVVAALGAPPAGVVLFEVLLAASSTFNHANLALPGWVDRALRWILVTPDMHRVHHSIDAAETRSNFGFALAWWDRLGGTYRAQPAAGHAAMTLGIPAFRDPADLGLGPLLVQPLRAERASDPAAGRPAPATASGEPRPPRPLVR